MDIPQSAAPPIYPTFALVRMNSVFNWPRTLLTNMKENAVGSKAMQIPRNNLSRSFFVVSVSIDSFLFILGDQERQYQI
jgi:hypothetical protein